MGDDALRCLDIVSLTLAGDSVGRHAWVDYLSTRVFACDSASAAVNTCRDLSAVRSSRDDFQVDVEGRRHVFRHVKQVRTVVDAEWLGPALDALQLPDTMLLLSAGLWNLKWDAPDAVPGSLFMESAALIALLERAPRDRVLVTGLTPIEANATFPAHYTPELVLAANAHLSTAWARRGFSWVDPALAIVADSPNGPRGGRTTVDGTHYPPETGAAIMQRTLEGACALKQGRSGASSTAQASLQPAPPLPKRPAPYPKLTTRGVLGAGCAVAFTLLCAAVYLYGSLPSRLSSLPAFLAVHIVACSAVWVVDVARLLPIVDKDVAGGWDALLYLTGLVGAVVMAFGVVKVRGEGQSASKAVRAQVKQDAATVVGTAPRVVLPSGPAVTVTFVKAATSAEEAARPTATVSPALAEEGAVGATRDVESASATGEVVVEGLGAAVSSLPSPSKEAGAIARPPLHPTPHAVEEPSSDFFPLSQTLEYKGWMMLAFLAYHYWDVKASYNPIRVCVAAYLFLTGYGNYCSLSRKGPSLHKLATAVVRINLLPALVMAVTQKGWLLYYIAPLHTVWTVVVYAFFWLPDLPSRVASTLPGKDKGVKLLALLLLLLLAFEVPTAIELLAWPFSPLLQYCGSLKEFAFRSRLDAYASWSGMVYAALVPTLLPTLLSKVEEGVAAGEEEGGGAARYLPAWMRHGRVAAVAAACATTLCVHAWGTFPMGRDAYNGVHRFTSWVPLWAFLALRNLTPWLRSVYSPGLAVVGGMSLELYILQFHVWMARSAKALVMALPDTRELSFLLHTSAFFLLAYACSLSTRCVLKYLDGHAHAAYAAAGGVLALIAFINAMPSACPAAAPAS